MSDMNKSQEWATSGLEKQARIGDVPLYSVIRVGQKGDPIYEQRAYFLRPGIRGMEGVIMSDWQPGQRPNPRATTYGAAEFQNEDQMVTVVELPTRQDIEAQTTARYEGRKNDRYAPASEEVLQRILDGGQERIRQCLTIGGIVKEDKQLVETKNADAPAAKESKEKRLLAANFEDVPNGAIFRFAGPDEENRAFCKVSGRGIGIGKWEPGKRPDFKSRTQYETEPSGNKRVIILEAATDKEIDAYYDSWVAQESHVRTDKTDKNLAKIEELRATCKEESANIREMLQNA